VKWAEAAGLSLNDERLAEIYLNWGEALRRSGRYDEAMAHFVQALPLAQGELKLAVAHQICSVEAMRGGSVAEFSRLAPSLEQELADAGDTWALVALRWTQGFMAAMQGEVARARACSAAGWCVARRLVARGDEAPVWLEPRGYIGLARCHEWWADWRRAIRYANKALALDTAHNDLNGIAASHATLGTARYSLGEWDQALRHFERCSTAESIGDALRQGFGQSLLARLSMRRGAPQEAIPVLQLQERMARAADAAAYVAQMLRHLAEAHLLAGDLEAALSTAREGSELAERCGMKREWGGSLRILGEALAQSGELLEAERHLLRAIALAKRIGCRYDLAEAHRSLGRLYRERGAAEAARKHVGVALTLFEDLGAEHDAAKTRRLLSDFARA
jgi:tetratricopeptide (TPR) repeat protein